MTNQQTPSTFDAFNLSLRLIGMLAPLAKTLQGHDRDLTKQLRRAASSVSLNLSEGRKRTGRDRLYLWRVAAGSADETRACLLVAQAWGYLPEDVLTEALDLLDRIVAICWRLTNR